MKMKQKRDSKQNNEILRDLMIKLKNNSITADELELFRCKIDKMIWKVIHSKYCTFSKEDIYQEIWCKILRVKDRWDENANVYVDTWLWRIAVSALGDMRYKLTKLKNEISITDLLTEDNNMNNCVINYQARIGNKKIERLEKIYKFLDSLEGKEKKLVEYTINPPQDLINWFGITKQNKRNKLSRQELQQILGITKTEFQKIIKNLKSKFDEIMQADWEIKE